MSGKSRWYAVWHLGQGIIHRGTWAQVSPKILGVSGVKHRAFNSQAAAQAWLANFQSATTVGRPTTAESVTLRPPIITATEPMARPALIPTPVTTPSHYYYGTTGTAINQFKPLTGDSVLSNNYGTRHSINTGPIAAPTRFIDGWFIRVYTDGSCLGSLRRAGWAYVITSIASGQEVLVDSTKGKMTGPPGSDNHTNNRAELMAILQALRQTRYNPLNLYIDSKYSIRSLTSWAESWQCRGWITTSGTPVKNQDLIQLIRNMAGQRMVNYQHIPAHQGHIYNEMADRLAKEAASSESS